MRRLGGISAVAIAALLAVGCAGSPRVEADETATPSSEPLPEKCLVATGGAISALQEDVASTVPGVEFGGHGVIESENGDGFWYIALEFSDEDLDYTATWGTFQDPTANEEIAYVAVDDVAALTGTYKQPVDFQGVTSSQVGATDCIVD